MLDIQQIAHQFPELHFQENVSLAPYTYMKVGGNADLYVEVEKKDDLCTLSSYCFKQRIPFTVIGGASNLIIPDEGLHKLVIRNLTSAIEIKSDTSNSSPSKSHLVVADSGVVTAVLAKKTADSGLTGFEYFVGVPGTIGGAIYNNSHFSANQLIGNYLVSVEVCTNEGEVEVWSAEELELGYDQSIFHHTAGVILSATFRLESGDPAQIQARIIESARKRATTQPIGIPSSGCMFRNPKISSEQATELRAQLEIPESALKHFVDGTTQIAAGFLIDQAGLKGTTVGGAQVSEKHATYIINTGRATAHDVDALATEVEQKVFEKFGVKLEREVFFVK